MSQTEAVSQIHLSFSSVDHFRHFIRVQESQLTNPLSPLLFNTALEGIQIRKEELKLPLLQDVIQLSM